MMLAHTRQRSPVHMRHAVIVRVGADATEKPSFGNKYINIGLFGALGLMLIGQPLPAAILLGSALSASAMTEGS